MAQPTSPNAQQKPSSDPELVRDRYGVWLVLAAFALLAIVFGVAISQFTSAADVAAIVGSVGAIIGTIVGAFFGVHAGSSGRQTAEAGRQAAEAGRAKAERTAQMALAQLDPKMADGLMKEL